MVAKIHKCYDAFCATDAARTAATTGHEISIVKEKHIIANEAFPTLCTRVSALILVNGKALYSEFIDQLNIIITHLLPGKPERKKKN
ncbi:MAG: hypothetical protein OSJ36_08490 [Odoribacter sp.]|nr:hypothetical protein [Odoribacter sp.]